MNPSRFLLKVTAAGLLAAGFGFSATSVASDDNPPGPAGGPGTNWENPPGPRGGPGSSPDVRPDRSVTIGRESRAFKYADNGYYYNPGYGYWNPDRGFWNQEKKCFYDRDNNPPGRAGGRGTNWENPPGYKGGAGSSPDKYGKCG